MAVRRHKFVILGAGPTGLGAARRLLELGERDFHVFEASDHAGGLASSYLDEAGFTWDVGGHVHFSHYARYDRAVEDALGPEGFFERRRDSQVWIKGRFVPYPFQLNIHRLPFLQRWRCFFGLAAAPKNASPANFREHVLASFGAGIADAFLLPYNEKVWAYPPERLGVMWTGERVAAVKLRPVLSNLLLRRDASAWGPNNVFRFPKRGGTGALWAAMAKKIGDGFITYHARADRVDDAKREVAVNGESVGYEHLISSVPLRDFASQVDGVPDAAKDAARRLTFSSTHAVGIGVRGALPDVLRGKSWIYFPDRDLPFYRVTVLSNYSPHCVPEDRPHWSLLAEISESPGHNAGLTGAVEKTEAGLRRAGFLRPGDAVVSRWHRRAPYGYPTPTVDRDALLAAVQPELEKRNIYSRGRFGGWKYEASNQDHVFMQGVEVVDRLVSGTPEVTYPTPEVANRRP